MYFSIDGEENLKRKLLLCAINEFAEYGYEGARVDNIVKNAGCSKQTVYHHYGNKENLFIEVLEYTYDDIRSKESMLVYDVDNPVENLEKIIDFTWNYYRDNIWFLKIINTENQSRGVHLKKSTRIAEINSKHINIMSGIVQKGEAQGVFRSHIDPVQLNISIAALGFFYLVNQHTLSHVYKFELTEPEALEKRHQVIKDTIMRWVLK